MFVVYRVHVIIVCSKFELTWTIRGSVNDSKFLPLLRRAVTLNYDLLKSLTSIVHPMSRVRMLYKI